MFTPYKKSYDQPRHILKSRDITLPTKVRLVRGMVFPVVMYVCESWTIKKALPVDNSEMTYYELMYLL